MSRLLRTCATSVNLADASRPSHRAGCASPGWPSAPDRSPTPRAIVVSCRVVSCRVVKFDPWTGLESRQETGREHRTAASSHGRMDAWTHGRNVHCRAAPLPTDQGRQARGVPEDRDDYGDNHDPGQLRRVGVGFEQGEHDPAAPPAGQRPAHSGQRIEPVGLPGCHRGSGHRLSARPSRPVTKTCGTGPRESQPLPGILTVSEFELPVWRSSRLLGVLGLLAQLAEQRTFNPRVQGSIPWRPTTLELGFYLSGQGPSVVSKIMWDQCGTGAAGAGQDGPPRRGTTAAVASAAARAVSGSTEM